MQTTEIVLLITAAAACWEFFLLQGHKFLCMDLWEHSHLQNVTDVL